MSFEYQFVPSSGIDDDTLAIVAVCFEVQIASYAVALNPSNGFANRNYYFIGNVRGNWPEDFTICLEKAQCYLCFNSATGEQRADIIDILTHCLQNAGLNGLFEEL